MSISSEIYVGFVAQAMVLAAGRGERMRPLTDATPKPLLPVRGQPLMQWPMQALARGGFVRQLLNTAWLGEQIPAHFGNGVTKPWRSATVRAEAGLRPSQGQPQRL